MQRASNSRAERRAKPGRIHAVLSTLGREIAQGVLVEGGALPPEHDLEVRFAVGRGVVREAIKSLSAKGLVQVRPRHGTHVRPRAGTALHRACRIDGITSPACLLRALLPSRRAAIIGARTSSPQVLWEKASYPA